LRCRTCKIVNWVRTGPNRHAKARRGRLFQGTATANYLRYFRDAADEIQLLVDSLQHRAERHARGKQICLLEQMREATMRKSEENNTRTSHLCQRLSLNHGVTRQARMKMWLADKLYDVA
jgi:hypothetical protein